MPEKDRTRLIIGDALSVCPISRSGWFEAVSGDSILMSFDPVAHDAVGLDILCEARTAEGHAPKPAREMADVWLAKSAELGLGANTPDDMNVVELTL